MRTLYYKLKIFSLLFFYIKCICLFAFYLRTCIESKVMRRNYFKKKPAVNYITTFPLAQPSTHSFSHPPRFVASRVQQGFAPAPRQSRKPKTDNKMMGSQKDSKRTSKGKQKDKFIHLLSFCQFNCYPSAILLRSHPSAICSGCSTQDLFR